GKGLVVQGATSQSGDLAEFLSSGSTVLARVDANGYIGEQASGYFNFGSTTGSSGYGIRDNSGTIECKNSGGSWAAYAGGGGTPGGATTQVQFNNSGAFAGDSGFTYAGSGAATITGAAATALSVTTTSTTGTAISGVASAFSGQTYGVSG